MLLDIDGVLTVSWRPLPGAVEAVTRLRDAGFAVALVTNTTSRTRAWMASTLSAAGFPVGIDDIFTAPAITAAYLARHHPGARCLLLNSGDIAEDLAGVTIIADDEAEADVVILGGAGSEFSYAAVNRAFRCLLDDARLVVRVHRALLAGSLALAGVVWAGTSAHAAPPSKFHLAGDTAGVVITSETDYADGTALAAERADRRPGHGLAADDRLLPP